MDWELTMLATDGSTLDDAPGQLIDGPGGESSGSAGTLTLATQKKSVQKLAQG